MSNSNEDRVRGALVLVLVLVTWVGLLSCGIPASSGTAQVDWVNFINFKGITYVGDPLNQGRALQESDLGPQFAKVTFKVSGNITTIGYQARDGDAAFLNAGTQVYTVKGYQPTFRLAAHGTNDHNRLVLFEADTNPSAKKGSDLLDIAGKVLSISVNSEQDGKTEIAAILDPKQVAALVALVLTAPVDQNRSPQDEPQYFIAFHLSDGTTVTRQYGLHTRELSRGILVPKAFGDAIEQALHR